jgi:diacylglycerol kinase
MSTDDQTDRPWRRLKGWQKLLFSFRAAGAGLKEALETQQNLRLHLLAAGMVIAAALVLRVSRIEAAMLLICIGAVIAAETFNTALERLVDLACPQIDERARSIKDASAAAVLVAALMASVVGVVILGPRAWEWWRGAGP